MFATGTPYEESAAFWAKDFVFCNVGLLDSSDQGRSREIGGEAHRIMATATVAVSPQIEKLSRGQEEANLNEGSDLRVGKRNIQPPVTFLGPTMEVCPVENVSRQCSWATITDQRQTTYKRSRMFSPTPMGIVNGSPTSHRPATARWKKKSNLFAILPIPPGYERSTVHNGATPTKRLHLGLTPMGGQTFPTIRQGGCRAVCAGEASPG